MLTVHVVQYIITFLQPIHTSTLVNQTAEQNRIILRDLSEFLHSGNTYILAHGSLWSNRLAYTYGRDEMHVKYLCRTFKLIGNYASQCECVCWETCRVHFKLGNMFFLHAADVP